MSPTRRSFKIWVQVGLYQGFYVVKYIMGDSFSVISVFLTMAQIIGRLNRPEQV